MHTSHLLMHQTTTYWVQALTSLGCMEHRGACSADADSGDGAGIMTQVPWKLFKEDLPDLNEQTTGCAAFHSMAQAAPQFSVHTASFRLLWLTVCCRVQSTGTAAYRAILTSHWQHTLAPCKARASQADTVLVQGGHAVPAKG